jgi:Ca-activated chloride channel family protein
LKDNQDGKRKSLFCAGGTRLSSAAIILLTDGQRTTGVDSGNHKLAADRGVRYLHGGRGHGGRVETIGFEGWSCASNWTRIRSKASPKTQAE